MLLLLYVTTCLLVAFVARARGHNMFLFFLLAIAITPFITLIILLFFIPSKGRRVICYECKHEQQQLKNIDYCSHCGQAL